MKDQPINFYLNQQSIEIIDRLENINKKFKQIIGDIKRTETILEDKKEENFEELRIDARIRK
jgi:hypothetical protein